MNVDTIMSRPVVSCRADDTLNQAARLMWENDCGFLPVLEEGRLVGVVTDRDVCMGAYTQGKVLSAIRVGEVMSKGLTTCTPSTDITDARKLMGHERVRRVPVVSGGDLVGIVSINDIALAARASHRGAPTMAQVGETLAAICEHRTAVPVAAE